MTPILSSAAPLPQLRLIGRCAATNLFVGAGLASSRTLCISTLRARIISLAFFVQALSPPCGNLLFSLLDSRTVAKPPSTQLRGRRASTTNGTSASAANRRRLIMVWVQFIPEAFSGLQIQLPQMCIRVFRLLRLLSV